ncbi:MAG: hypothetical protein EA358_01920 [Flavobacteriales bacterium]|nr:MAG: hypothetical protein EA358_01920 [Flavobacteriales bacterium]
MKKSVILSGIFAIAASFALTSCDELDDLVGVTLTPSVPIEQILEFADPNATGTIVINKANYHVVDFTDGSMPSEITDNIDKMEQFRILEIEYAYLNRVIAAASTFTLSGEVILFEVPGDLSLVPANQSSSTPTSFPSDDLTEIVRLPISSSAWADAAKWTNTDNEGSFPLPFDQSTQDLIADYLLANKKIGIAIFSDYEGSASLDVTGKVTLNLEIKI